MSAIRTRAAASERASLAVTAPPLSVKIPMRGSCQPAPPSGFTEETSTSTVEGRGLASSGDSTALVVIPGETPYLFVERVWENDGSPGWRVTRHEVSSAVEAAFDKYKVLELVCDPWGYQQEIESWEKRYSTRRVHEYNTANRALMGPATDRLASAVLEGKLRHDGDKRLAQHFATCVPVTTPAGDVVSKDRRTSPRKIDLAVASILAFERAAEYGQPKSRGMTILR